MVWETLPDGTRWQLDWREDIPVSDEMRQWTDAVQRQMVERLALQPPPACMVPERALADVPDLRLIPGVVNVVHDPHVLQPPQSYADIQAMVLQEVAAQDAAMRAAEVRRQQERLTPSGVSGIQPEPPDTPYDAWCAGVEALLAECAARQAQTEEVLRDEA